MERQKLIEMSKEINKKLRKCYQQKFWKNYSIPCKPFGCSPRESIGPWPEIIYKGTVCSRSTLGLCSPCGYSNIPDVIKSRKVTNKSILFQTKFILNFFDEIIMQNQRRKKPYPNGVDCIFALTTTGSFFSEAELDRHTRIKILNMLMNYFKNYKLNVQIYIEAHARDIIKFHEKNYFKEIKDLLQILNVVIVLGFESLDDFARNVLYCKQLERDDFERAVDIVQKELGLVAGAFVFAGLHSMNDYETIMDVKNTLIYLKNKNIIPVVMTSNLKQFTMYDLLYRYGKYNLPDPRTILEIVKMLKETFPNIYTAEKWLIADPVGGPPEPEVHPFNNPRKITCDRCAKIIHKAIFGDYNLNEPNGLRETYDWKKFEEKLRPISNCKCKEKYEKMIEEQKKNPEILSERAETTIKFAYQKVEAYCDELSKQR